MVMTSTQQIALDKYLESATLENGYKACTFKQLADDLKKENIQVGKSTLQRWAKKFNFEKHLEKKIQIIIVDEADKTPEQKALAKTIKKDMVTVEKNSELMSKSYGILERFLDDTIFALDEGKKVSRDDIKIAKDIAVLTSTREDKLLDRLSNSGSDKVSSDEIIEEFNTIDLDLEIEE